MATPITVSSKPATNGSCTCQTAKPRADEMGDADGVLELLGLLLRPLAD
jgi:hypothetical protein